MWAGGENNTHLKHVTDMPAAHQCSWQSPLISAARADFCSRRVLHIDKHKRQRRRLAKERKGEGRAKNGRSWWGHTTLVHEPESGQVINRFAIYPDSFPPRRSVEESLYSILTFTNSTPTRQHDFVKTTLLEELPCASCGGVLRLARLRKMR